MLQNSNNKKNKKKPFTLKQRNRQTKNYARR